MLQNKKLYLLDIDGTICMGEKLIPGAKLFLDHIRKKNAEYVFITNNATKGIAAYSEQFRKLGIETCEHNFMTASMVTSQYLREQQDKKVVFVLGTQSFMDELIKDGITVTTDPTREDIAVVCVSYDNTLTYDKLVGVCKLLTESDVTYIATNPDLTCPIEFGYVPDCGSICEMIAHATKKTPLYMGKPHITMVQQALRVHECNEEDAIIVGDRLYTDICCGVRAGVDTILVLSGESKYTMVKDAKYKPTYVFQDVHEIYEELVEIEQVMGQ